MIIVHQQANKLQNETRFRTRHFCDYWLCFFRVCCLNVVSDVPNLIQHGNKD